MKNTFADHVFLRCLDRSLTPPRQEYFFGPVLMPTGTVAVPTVVEYDHADIKLKQDTSHQDADDLNGESHFIVTMRSPAFRTRSQGLTRPDTPLGIFKTKPNGVWGVWTKWDDTNKNTSFEIGYLKNEKGSWSMEVGPGLQPSGWLGKVANDVSGSQGAPFYLTVDKVGASKPTSCDALFAMFPSGPPERAPGHSLSDSYKRTQTIAEDNASKGISDTINPAYVRRLRRQIVCYSFDAAGTCRLSGENVWVPGDLEQPLDWNKFLQADACSSPQSAPIEIVLKGSPAQNNRTRVIRCTVASYLAHVRMDLIDLGVKDVPSVDTEIAKNPPSPAAAPRSAFRETPDVNGVTWVNGDPIFKDGNTTVKLSKTFITIEQGSTSAKFSIAPQGIGIMLVPPPDARRREVYNTQNHNYANNDANNGDRTGTYLSGPPPGMMANLAPFVQIAMKAVDQAKQTPNGARWDDQYFRNFLKPYDTLSSR